MKDIKLLNQTVLDTLILHGAALFEDVFKVTPQIKVINSDPWRVKFENEDTDFIVLLSTFSDVEGWDLWLYASVDHGDNVPINCSNIIIDASDWLHLTVTLEDIKDDIKASFIHCLDFIKRD